MSASATAKYPSRISPQDKALIAAAFCRGLITGLGTFIVSPLRGSSGAVDVSTHVKLAILRKFLTNTTIFQLQYLARGNDIIYNAYAKEKGFAPEVLTMEDGTKAHWVGNSKSKNILIWYHGGGFNLPTERGHYRLAQTMVQHARASGKDLGVLFPSYTLAPQMQYPRQLEQGIETLRYTLNQLGLEPSNIMIGGDSAGANLTLGVLSHILHPHPTIPALKLSAPLKGAVLFAPWASFATDDPSMKANTKKDIITPFLLDIWSASFLGKSTRDNYNEPIRTDVEWWRGLKDIVKEILVTGGTDELLIDSIKEMARKLEAAHPQTTTLVAKHEFHCQPIMAQLGPPVGQQADGIRNWIAKRL